MGVGLVYLAFLGMRLTASSMISLVRGPGVGPLMLQGLIGAMLAVLGSCKVCRRFGACPAWLRASPRAHFCSITAIPRMRLLQVAAPCAYSLGPTRSVHEAVEPLPEGAAALIFTAPRSTLRPIHAKAVAAARRDPKPSLFARSPFCSRQEGLALPKSNPGTKKCPSPVYVYSFRLPTGSQSEAFTGRQLSRHTETRSRVDLCCSIRGSDQKGTCV